LYFTAYGIHVVDNLISTEMHPKKAGLLSRSLFLSCMIIAGITVAWSLLVYFLFHYNIFYHDEWLFYNHRLVPLVEHQAWALIWAARNGHRIVFPALIQAGNLAWFNANLSNLIILNVAAQIASAWVLSRVALKELGDQFSGWLLTALILAVLLWLGNQYAINWGFGLTFTLGVLGAVTGCYCVFRSVSAATTRGHWFWLAAGMAGALLASLSWGSGVAVWPVLVLMSLALRLPRSATFTLMLSGAAIIVAYMVPAPGDTGFHISLTANADDIATAANMALGMLGNMPAHLFSPFASKNSAWLSLFARAAGLLDLLCFGGLVLLWWRQRRTRNWLLPLLGVVLFVIGTAAIIGVVRGNIFGIYTHRYGLIGRYRIFSSLLWAALLCGLMPFTIQLFRHNWRQPALAIITLVMLLLLVPSQEKGFTRSWVMENHQEQAGLALVTGVKDHTRLRRIAPARGVKAITAFMPYVRRHGLTVLGNHGRSGWAHFSRVQTKRVRKFEVAF
jgi:hypothetical protein